MFALKSRIEILARTLLIVVILFNALVPTTNAVKAVQESASTIHLDPQAEESKTSVLPVFDRPQPKVSKTIEEQPTAAIKNADIASQASVTDLKASAVFIENIGQFDSRARFQMQSGDVTLYFSDDSIWLTLFESTKDRIKPNKQNFSNSSTKSVLNNASIKGVNIKVNLVGSNAHPTIEPFGSIETNYSYFLGKSAEDWQTDVPAWHGIRYKDIYPGLDLEITASGSQFRWEFIITNQSLFKEKNKQLLQNGIRVQINGQQKLGMKKNATEILTEVGSILLPEFHINGQTVQPELQNNDLIIQIPELLSYLDKTKSVVYVQNDTQLSTSSKSVVAQAESLQNLPPFSPSDNLLYSTYLGGSIPISSPIGNPSADDRGLNMVIEGNDVYIAGFSTSADFPNATGTFDVKFGETPIAQAYSPFRPFIGKLNLGTNQFTYVDYFNLAGDCYNPYNGMTYLVSGYIHGLSVDSGGNVYLGGSTLNFDFPTTPNAIDNTIGEGCLFNGAELKTFEGFVAKINPAGTDLLYSSFLGGSGWDVVVGVAADQSGNLYAAGNTTSTDIPANGTVYDGTYHGGNGDMFVTKINTDSGQQDYFSYLGGNSNESPSGVTLGQDGSLYVFGRTWSTSFTGATPGSGHTCSNCLSDGIVVKMTSMGGVAYSKYVGGNKGDIVSALALNQSNQAFIAGYTNSTDFPQATSKIDTDAYVAKLDVDGSILYDQRFGGKDEEGYWNIGDYLGAGISVDELGNIYVVGTTVSADFPYTLTAFDQAVANQDVFLTKIDPQKNQILYSTFLGGSNFEIMNGHITLDSQDNVSILVSLTNSPDFPGASNFHGGWDMAIAKLSTNVPVIPIDMTLSFCPGDCAVSTTNTEGSGKKGGPINTRTGAYDYSYTDLSLPTTAGTLSFERIYSSQAISKYDRFGPGWTYNHDSRLILSNDPLGVTGQILFKAHSANLYNFYDMGDGTYKANPGIKASLTKVSLSPVRYEIKDGTQATYLFDGTGRLLTYSDPQGNEWNYIPDANGRLEYIQADGGAHYLRLHYDAQGRIDNVSDQTGRSVSYHYDANGDLDTVEDVLQQVWTYEYHETLSHTLTRVVAPGRVTVERTEYYPDGRAWKQFNGADKLVVELTYNSDGTTTVKDALDHISTHTYDARGTLIKESNSTGTEQKQYDFNFHPGLVTDPSGNTTALTWSGNGANLTDIKDALQNQTHIEYGDSNNPVSIFDPLGYANNYATEYSYTDANFPSLPTRIEYPLSFDGGTTFIGTNYQYYLPSNGASAGKVELITDALGNKTHYTYTPTGQTDTVTTAYQTTNAQTTDYDYNDLGYLTQVTVAGVITKNEYDDSGRLLKTIQNYDPLRLQNAENKYNLVTEYRYDSRGNQIAVLDTYATITRTYYDLANRPVTVVQNLFINGTLDDIDAALNLVPSYNPAFPDRNIRTDTVYDDAGNVIATSDPEGIITRTYYDEENRPKLLIENWAGTDLYGDINSAPAYNPAYPDQNVRTENFYDINGNLIAVKDTLGVYTRTYYDKLNRPETTVQNLVGQDISVSTPPERGSDSNIRTDTYYDANGNVIATKDPRGVITRTYYDQLNRPVAVVQDLAGKSISDSSLPDPNAGQCGTEENICTFTYYDQVGNGIATVDSRGIVTRTYYDSANRPIASVQNWVGANIYDNNVPARGSAQSDQNVRTDIVYDSFGRKDYTTDPLGHVTKYHYNEVGQLIKVTTNYVNNGLPQNEDNQRNIVTEFAYDALGRQYQTTDTLGRVTMNSYDDLGRVISSTQNYLVGQPQNYKAPSGDRYNIITTYSYDSRGNQIASTNKADVNKPDVVTRTYFDALGRPVTVVRNLTGNINNPTPPVRSAPVDPVANLRTDTVYLGNGTVDFVLNEMGKKTDYTYDALGRLVSELDPLSNPISYEYDVNGNRTLMTTFVSDTETVSTKYEYDGLNRLAAVVENYRVNVVADNETNVRTSYTYDAQGNRLTIRDGNRNLDGRDYRTAFTYDAFGRLQTESDPLGNLTAYKYNAAGNLIRQTEPEGQRICLYYDELNRLIGKEYRTDDNCPANPTYDVTFNYDALGRRTGMDDSSSGLGATSWGYNNLDLPKQITDPFGTGISYDYDALGNRTNLSYAGQTVAYTYDPLNRLDEVSANNLPNTVKYGYYASGQLKTMERPNGVNTVYNYFDNGWLKDITHSSASATLASYKYEYYKNGNRKQVIENVLLPPSTVTPSTPTDTPTVAITPSATPTYTPTTISIPQTLQVTKTQDTNDGICDSDCSLREAIQAANSLPDTNTILIPAGTYTLTIAGWDNDSGDLDIIQPVIIDGDNTLNTIVAGGTGWNDRIFDLSASGVIEIRDLTVKGGNVNNHGGGIYSYTNTNVTLDRVIVDSNAAHSLQGGGIFTFGSMTITNSVIVSNTASGNGGGIFNGGTLTITNSTISGNTANDSGGGISNQSSVTLTSVTVTNNVAGAGLVHGSGGGIQGGTISIKNTIIAGNTDLYGSTTEVHPDCTGPITSQGHNIISIGYGCTITGGTADQIGTKSKPIDPKLGTLQDNGGNTKTQALLTGSPAINAGDNNGCPTTDQRGFTRIGTCDIGAYEFGAVASLNSALASSDSALPSSSANNAQFFLVKFPLAPKTPTPTQTPTPPGPTATPTPTNTPSSTPTETPTNLPSNTPTDTPTLTANDTPTDTPTSTSTGAATDTPSNTPTETPTLAGASATPTNTSTATSTSTPTVNPGPLDTGFQSATVANAVGGSVTNPSYALLDDGLFAVDQDSGGSGSQCQNDGTSITLESFSFSIPENAIIKGVEVRLDAKVDSASDSSVLCAALVENFPPWGGLLSDWKGTPFLSTDETTYFLGGPTDTWGYADGYTPETFNNPAKFSIEISGVSPARNRDFYLDYAAVKVYYEVPPATATPTATSTPTNTATATATFTPTATSTPMPSGWTAIDYVYDPLSRLKQANYSTGDYYHYNYDAAGNRLTQETLLGGLPATTNYVYDEANRLSSVNGVTYTWDNNGNLLDDGVNVYTYDDENRLLTLIGPSISANYSYNGLGDRLKETINGNTTTFTMDLNTGLTQALSDGTNNYIYGLDRIAQVQSGTPEYFLSDALGSVRQMTETNAQIIYARTYDPYGVVTSTNGSSSSAYGYTGEYTGDYNELVYLRARFYAPGQGRFLTKDTWEGAANRPLSLNHWSYVSDNPIIYSDPSGYVECYYPQDGTCSPTLPGSKESPNVVDYRETIYPRNVTFTGTGLASPKIIYNRNCVNEAVVAPGTFQSQFIPSRCEPHWPLGDGKAYHSGLCGQLSIAAILTSLIPGLTANDVVDAFTHFRPNSAPDYTGSQELGDFINQFFGDSLYAWTQEVQSVSTWGGYGQIPIQIHSWLGKSSNDIAREYVIAGIRVSGYSGQLRYGVSKNFAYPGSAKHWVVITGISDQWQLGVDNSPWNWIRIYNPFNNHTEYYWWEDFQSSWQIANGSMLRVTMRFW